MEKPTTTGRSFSTGGAVGGFTFAVALLQWHVEDRRLLFGLANHTGGQNHLAAAIETDTAA
jgi:hypothetical protein